MMKLTGTKRVALGLLVASAVLLMAAAESRAGGFSISFGGGRSAYRSPAAQRGGAGHRQVRSAPRHSYIQRRGHRGRRGYVHRPVLRVVIIRNVTPRHGRPRVYAARPGSRGSRVIFSPQPYYPARRGGVVTTNWLR